MEQKKLVDTEKNPFFRNAEIALFLLKRDGVIVGRIAAIIDHRYNDFHNTRTGFFGFYECEDHQESSDRLFHAVETWLKEKGMEKVLGPSKPGMMDEIGILVEGFDRYPAILMPYNEQYNDKLIVNSRYHAYIDLLYSLDTHASLTHELYNSY